MRRAFIPTVIVVLSIVAGACAPSNAAHTEGEGEDRVPTCEAGFTTPSGFRATGTLEDPYDDHVGIRLDLADDARRELHYFAGIPGEFGEGLPSVGEIAVALDLEGALQGGEGTWVLSWRAPGPCGVRAVLGSGFARAEFLDTLVRAGIIPAP